MKKNFRLFIFLTFLAMSLPFFLLASAISSELLLTAMDGEVLVQKKSQSNWEKAKAGELLKTGDKIKTGRKSQATTVSKEGHRILIKQKTIFEISQLGPLEWEFKEELGKVRLKIAKLSSGQGLKVRTPTAVCAVRGTEFEVTVLEDRSTTLDVFQGVVNFTDAEGAVPEIPVLENQRITREDGAAPKPVETIPEGERQKGEGPEGKLPERAPNEEKEELRNEIAKEVGFDLDRETIESGAAFELQSAQYQEAKTLIDAFGQRVRLEEYITRPSPESFKLVSLNTRADRFDSGFFEVVANKALPENLADAGNLWFSASATKPEFYAVKQRWFVTNTVDSVNQMALDGDSKEVTFQQPEFSDTGAFVSLTGQKGFQTVFDHRYEFINGNPAALDKIWNDSGFRPKDNGVLSGISVTGMMLHMRPIKVDMTFTDPFTNATTIAGSFYKDVFVTRTETPGETGKLVVTTHEPDSNPFLAHFTEKHSYINFLDENGNGRYDEGELTFSDLNRNGTLDAGEPSGKDPFLVAQKPWAWQTGEDFMTDDFGKVLDFRNVGLTALAEGSQDKNAIADAFEKVNFERVWKSSEFKEPDNKIDIVMTPRIFIKSGLLDLQTRGSEPLSSRQK